ncbi:sensory box/GGDEF family protein [Klebsiella pneumoniae]|uniref:Sensory box/GGDEF family protein n=1 Tax=Klebsiella pneumoniae TaxID=573 RepID=A0A377XAI8_KLEPN|nr:sensory box/GGDEF family protein [Klebsiella pneumoniae]
MRGSGCLAARLWHCFSGKQTFAATEVVLSASIGISVYPEDGTDIIRYWSNSDLAMYRQKAALDHKICWLNVKWMTRRGSAI